VYRNVAFYRHRFHHHHIDIGRMKSLPDLHEIPFTTREDLRQSYPYDMFAVPLRDILRLHSTSGTTGKPIVVGYTRGDLKSWTECMARVLAGGEITEHDFIQIAFDFSLFTGGFGFYQGAEAIGASVIPSSIGALEKQVLVMKDYKTTALACTPSYALRIAAQLEERGLHPEQLSLRTGIFGAEPWSESMRREIEDGLHIRAYDIYGLTELMGPGVAWECEARDGLHVNEDHFLAEVVDPATGEPLPVGTEGELVFTTLTREGFPLIRYRTGDIATLLAGRCRCGRTFIRISRIRGRNDDMIFYQGVKFFPSQIEEILLEEEGTAPHYRIVLDRERGEDTVEIQVEISEKRKAASPSEREAVRERILKRVEALIGIRPRVSLEEAGSIPRPEGTKARRITDRRTA
jgi:phenylacetate-CoA ligase